MWAETVNKAVKAWDFVTYCSTQTDKTSITTDGTVTLDNTACDVGTEFVEGMAFQGGSNWIYRNFNGNKGVYNSNSGGRKFGILDLKKGDVITITASADVTLTKNVTGETISQSGSCTVTEDGDAIFTIDRYVYIYTITVKRDVDVYPVADLTWNFKTATWNKESGFGTEIITINSQSCTYATGDLEGLALQGGSGTSWTVNTSGLTQGNGGRNIAVLDLKAGDIVIVETATTLSALVNGISLNDTYTGTCKFQVTADGAFGFTTTRNAYITSITILREQEIELVDGKNWAFKTATWNKESGFGTETITINSQSCTYAIGDLEGLALQGGSGTSWTVNTSGLTQGNGGRNIAVLDLKAGDIVIVETATTLSALVNGISLNDTYTGTCKFQVTADGAFGFTTTRNAYITSIKVYRIVEDEPEQQFIVVSATKQYSTFCSTQDLDFSNVEGLEAYIVPQVNESSATISKVEKVPAGTGLILMKTDDNTFGTTTNFNVPVAKTTDPIGDNCMVGVTTETDMSGIGNAYILSNGMFYKCSGGTLAAGKAYLYAPEWATSEAREFRIIRSGEDDNTTTVSEKLNMKDENSAPAYNLAGQRVNSGFKGLVIKNGKKMILK